jgi:peptide/nickel transport system substrate-binding protein
LRVPRFEGWREKRRGISRTVSVVIVVVIIVIVIGGFVVATSMKSTTTTNNTTTSTSTTSTTSTTSIPPTSSTTSTTSTSSGTSTSSAPQTLVMDDSTYPINGVNVLTFPSEVPWPDWFQISVYQPLLTANLTAEYQSGLVQYVPVLATGWTASDDNTTYTLTLRQGVTFSNGDPFNAYQMWGEYYVDYYLSGNTSGWYQSYTVFNMNNVDFGPSTIALMNQSGLITPNAQLMSIMTNSSWPIYVTGPNTLVFHLQAPFLYFLGTFISYEGMSYDTQYVLTHGGFGTPVAVNPTFNDSPIPGTGPYIITAVDTNDYISFTQSSTYWGANLTSAEVAANPAIDPGHVKNVVVNFVPDDLARYTALTTGAAQIVAIDSTANWPLVLASPSKFSYTVLPPWSADVSAIALNTNLYPTNITAVRQAIVRAINYTEINKDVFYGDMTPGMGPEYPLYSQYYDLGNHGAYQYNVTAAEDILKAAGINPSTLGTLVFRTVATCNFCEEIAQIVESNLAQIGLTVTITSLSDAEYSSVYGNYASNVQNAAMIGQLSILGGETWAPSALTPADNWVSFVSNNSNWGNWASYTSPSVQACINDLLSSANVTGIEATCTAAQTQIYDDAPYAWLGFAKLWYYSGSLVWQTGVVKSFSLDPDWNGIDTMPLINTVVLG